MGIQVSPKTLVKVIVSMGAQVSDSAFGIRGAWRTRFVLAHFINDDCTGDDATDGSANRSSAPGLNRRTDSGSNGNRIFSSWINVANRTAARIAVSRETPTKQPDGT